MAVAECRWRGGASDHQPSWGLGPRPPASPRPAATNVWSYYYILYTMYRV